ncbi:MAG: protein translocase subunit SecF, partial [Candidatus Promineifilaceae bacterium]
MFSFDFFFNLVENRRKYYTFSAILIGLGIAAMVYSYVTTGSIFQLGVDFRSGTRYEVQFTDPVTEDQIREVFTDAGVNNPSVIALRGEDLQNAWQIRAEFATPEESQAIVDTLEQLSPVIPGTLNVQSVSPTVGQEVTRAAFLAIGVAAIAILFYIMLVFRQVPNSFRYGASAVTAMIHDLFIIFGFAAITGVLLGWEVDALFLTAVLTVAGFSLQDTIVTFDRIRENISKRPFERYEKLVNRSVLETIHRSLATQMNAMFILVAILLFGGASIKPF